VILIDSSVWIDYFRGNPTPEADRFDSLLESPEALIGVPDMVLTEVLQGVDSDAEHEQVRRLMLEFPILALGGAAAALDSASAYRSLRRRGRTVRKTIDSLIATYCIRNDHELLYSDRDFDPFVKHLGLRSAMTA
jgi:predicted nucleic acid-binding protein